MICLSKANIINVARRSFSSTRVHFVRFRGTSASTPEFAEIGKICASKKEGLYQPGQLFLHRVFAYRGVIVCSFNVKVQGNPKINEAIGTSEILPYYQVLVNRDDWDYMNFRPDMTSYFVDSSVNREEKILNVIHGMDCVPHNEILPFTTVNKNPINHDLFPRLFEFSSEPSIEADVNFNIRRDLVPHFGLTNQRSWLAPQAVYKESTENIQVTVIPYFLGMTFSGGQQKYNWRYVVRLESLDRKPVVIRERLIKIFSMNNLQQVAGHGVDGANPRLTAENPAFQFSSVVDLLQPKGGHMWGRFTMERQDGSTFEISIPTIALECHNEMIGEQSEQSRQ
uniref:ApaG domain-containing protein n=1 Tax=Panagrolaimus sp. JU765 TaxID=591449 RepID=A0AC34Q1M9_9BILA